MVASATRAWSDNFVYTVCRLCVHRTVHLVRDDRTQLFS